MNNPSYNQTLAELEKSLGDLESARNQVTSVVSKSEEIIGAFSNILNAVKSFEEDTNLDKGTFAKRLNESFEQLQKELARFNEEIETHISGLKTSNENLTDSIRHEAEEAKNNLSNELEVFSESVETKKNEFNQHLSSLETSLGDRMQEVHKGFNALKDEIEKTEKRISQVDFKSELTSISNRVSQSEQTVLSAIIAGDEGVAENLNTRMRQLEEKLQKKHSTNLVVLIVGFIVLVVFCLISMT